MNVETGLETSIPIIPESMETIHAPIQQQTQRSGGLQPDSHMFGLKQDGARQPPPQIFSEDYDKRFPADAYGYETAPNARIWRVYSEEAAVFDGIMVGQSREGLDVMLVFAGLFSAIITSFLVQASQSLQANFGEMSVLLLHDLVSIQLATNTSGPNITSPSVNLRERYTPDAIHVWVNGLWVVSLTASLMVALVAVLVKQWLHHYMTLTSGTPQTRSYVRQFRFEGLEHWRVNVVIGMLPIIMNIALVLFLSGLVLFYVPLRLSLAWTIGVMTVVISILYLVSNVIPVFLPQCPYQTPLSDLFHYTYQLAVMLSSRIIQMIGGLYDRLTTSATLAAPRGNIFFLKSPQILETEQVRDNNDLPVNALTWLYSMTFNPTIHSLVLQSIGGLPPECEPRANLVWQNARNATTVLNMKSFRGKLISDYIHRSIPRPGCEDVVERLCRSCLFLQKANRLEHWRVSPTLDATEFGSQFQVVARVYYSNQANVDFCLNFILDHNDTPLHPFIWRDMLFRVLDRFNSDHTQVHPPTCARFLSLFFEDVSGPLLQRLAPIMPFQWAVDLYLDIAQNLLKIPTLLPFCNDVVLSVGPLYSLTTVCTKFAIREISLHRPAQLDDTYLELLARSLHNWRYLNHNSHMRLTFAMLIHLTEDLLVSIMDEPALDLHFSDEFIIQVRGAGATASAHYIYALIEAYEITAREKAAFSFPSLRRLVEPFIQYLSSSTTRSVLLGERECTMVSNALMSLNFALSRGLSEAYHLFIDTDCILMLFKALYLGQWDKASAVIVVGYASGISSIESDILRLESVAYLHEHRNLIMACLLLALPESPPEGFLILLKIAPHDPSWDQIRSTLTKFQEWIQHADGRNTMEFPLDGLCEGMHANELNAKLQARITRNYTQSLAMCLDVLNSTLK